MSRPRTLAFVFLLGALLTGSALGFTTSRVLAAREPAVRVSDQRSLRDVLAQRLDLSPDQRAAIDSILDARREAMEAVMARVRPEMDSVRVASRAAMRRLLSPAQQAEFDRMVAESQARIEKSRVHGSR
jgi:Spy/CpxP family protein refolding chaperone